ncbi:MAG TPA: hypothetical protein VJ810_17745, partial [Blastocatellia bacterium]|nr:hypothetical protein [Blastocatellia bacterium]
SWKSVCEDAGVQGFWFRWLRDTFKHRCELAGFGPFEIAKLMGHSSPVMTMEYSIVDHERALTLMRNRIPEVFRQKEKGESVELSQVIELIPTGTTL